MNAIDQHIPMGDMNLRPLLADDVSNDYVEGLNDPEVNKHMKVRQQPQTLSSVVQFVEENLIATNSILWGIWILETNRLVGSVRLHNIDDDTNSCDIGVCVFDRSVWGKGVASRAIRGVCNWGYKCLRLQTVVAGIEPENLGSWKAFTKAGFESPKGNEDRLGANRILNARCHLIARLPLIVSC